MEYGHSSTPIVIHYGSGTLSLSIDILAQYYKEFHCSVSETLLKKEEDWDKFNLDNIIPKAVSFDEEEEIKEA